MELSLLSINKNKSIRHALKKLNDSGLSTLFIINENKNIIGILTDGGIRRSLLNNFDLDSEILKIMKTDFIFLNINSPNDLILKSLNNNIKVIPLVNNNNEFVDYATINRLRRISISEPELKGNELTNVTNCIKTNWISSQGKFVSQFEKQFSVYHNNLNALSVSNGTVAIHLALVALGVGKGDEVIIPNLTFAASINAVIHCGATPVLADVDLDSWNIDILQIESLIGEKTKAIMAVHLFGNPCKVFELMELTKKYNLYLVQDCAESLGSLFNNEPLGIFGDVATFSFFGNKTITTGEGGMIIFKDPDIYKKANILRDHGMNKTKRYWHDFVGYNYRLTNLQAAVGVAQFERLDYFVKRKKTIAKIYFNNLNHHHFFKFQKAENNAFNSNWLFTIVLIKNNKFKKEDLMEYLGDKGIETRPIFFPLNVMNPYKNFGKSKKLKISNEISANGFSLPSSASLSDEEAIYICDHINIFIKNL